MHRNLRKFVRSERERRRIRIGKLARMIGYKNVSKGSNKIVKFEREGAIDEALFQSISEALELDPVKIQEAIEKDQRDWESWLDEPVPMEIVVRYMPAVYSRKSLPAEIETPEEAEDYARKYARTKGLRVCLILSRRETLWIDEEGGITLRTTARPGLPNHPYTSVGGRRFVFRKDERGFIPVALRTC